MVKKILLAAGISVLLISAVSAFVVLRPAPAPSAPGQSVSAADGGGAAAEAPSLEATGAAQRFSLVPEQSEARFQIDEVLRGEPKTVVGATDLVTGQIVVDPADLSTVQVGEITVNARGLETDDSRRNNTIANRILNSGQFELIRFTPKEFLGLPAAGEVGELYRFQIVGDLTIRDTSREVLFDVTLTPLSESTLAGSARSTVTLAEFNLSIPSVPFVASVGETVLLEIEFVAEAG